MKNNAKLYYFPLGIMFLAILAASFLYIFTDNDKPDQGNEFTNVNENYKDIENKSKKSGPQKQREFLEYLYKPFTESSVSNIREEYLRKNGTFKNLLDDGGTDNTTSWISIGPNGIFPSSPSNQIFSGRVISLEVDPDDDNVLFLGAASGGIWKSTNQGNSWFILIDSLTNPSVASIAIERQNHINVWFGTSNPYNGYEQANWGVYKSSDAGQSWQSLNNFPAGFYLGNKGITKIEIDPYRNNIIYIGSSVGLIRSSNGGNSWTGKLTGKVSDITISSDPVDTNSVVLVAIDEGGVSRSTNNGNTFGLVNSFLYSPSQIGRISLANHGYGMNKKFVYALLGGFFTREILGVFRSQDTGRTWTPLNYPPNAGKNQHWNNCIISNPQNADTVLLGFQHSKPFRSNDGANSWSDPSNDVHADIQCFASSSLNPNLVFMGCDGGVYKSTNFGLNWSNAGNQFLMISQIYYLEDHPSDPDGEWAGLQDNGIISGHDGFFGWNSITGGDGGDIAFKEDIPHFNISYWADEKTGLLNPYSIQRRINGINEPFTSGMFGTGGLQLPGPNLIYNFSDFYTFHNDTVYKAAGGNLPWSAVGGSPNNELTIVTRLMATPENFIYAAQDDINNPLRIWSPSNKSWSSPSLNPFIGRVITGFSYAGFYNGNRIVFASKSGMTGERVYRSRDNGQTWYNITSNLPDVINIASILAVNDKLIFLGADRGVFATTSGGVSWFKYSANLPVSPYVYDIKYRYFSDPEILIATYGRGAWSRDISDLEVSNDIFFTGKINKNWSDELNWFPRKPISGDNVIITGTCFLDEIIPLLNSIHIEPNDSLNLGTFELPEIAGITNNGFISTKNISATPIPHNRLWGGEIIFEADTEQSIPPGIYSQLTLTGSNKNFIGDVSVFNKISIPDFNDTLKTGIFELSGVLKEISGYGTIETRNVSGNPLPSGINWNEINILFSASGNQFIPSGNYNRLSVKNGFIKNLSGNVQVHFLRFENETILALNDFDLKLPNDFFPVNILFAVPPSSQNMIRTNSSGMLKFVAFSHSSFYPLFFPVGYISYNPVTITFNSLTNDTFGVSVSNSINPPPQNPNKVVNAMWKILGGNSGSANANIKVQYNSTQFAGEFENIFENVYMGRFDSAVWHQNNLSELNDLGNGEFEAKADGFSEFGNFALGNENVLPVELSSFTFKIHKNDVELTWLTSREKNNNGFFIERKNYNENEWHELSFVKANYSGELIEKYVYLDKSLKSGKYNYRLRQTDFNGNFEYFNLPDVIEISPPKNFFVSQNYPNPFNPVTKIDFEIPYESRVLMQVYDVSGRLINTLINETLPGGYYALSFNSESLSSGIYFYRILCESNSGNFVKTSKMMVLK